MTTVTERCPRRVQGPLRCGDERPPLDVPRERPQLGRSFGGRRVVYSSTFAHRTYALAAATGRLPWTWPDGEYSPVVTGGRRIYLTGRGRIYGLVR